MIRFANESAAEFTARMRGQQVTLTETIKRNVPSDDFTVWTPVTLAEGETVTIVGMTNAGFRGMEIAVRTAEGVYLPGIAENVFA